MGVKRLFTDHEQVWWIVPAGRQLRHAVTVRPGALPAGEVVQAFCTDSVKLPYETWPASKEPSSRRITERCPDCESRVADQQQRTDDLVVCTWDS